MRIEPVLTPSEFALVDEMAAIMGCKRAEVIKGALEAYRWFIQQTLAGSHVVARKPNGQEVSLNTAQLTPEELGVLATQLSEAQPIDVDRVNKSIIRGLYGI